MTEAEKYAEVLESRRNKIIAAGRCAETQGICRKLRRKILKAREQGIILS